MKKNYIFKFLLLLIPVSAFTLLSFSSGRNNGFSGSPGDSGNNCTACHSGTASNSNITITTNIPNTGYAFNTDYNITITNSGGGSRNGFQVTAEKNSNNQRVGTFTSVSGDTQAVNSGERITHTSSGNVQNSWSFNWKSPAADEGEVTFYGASVSGNSNGGNSGDSVFLGKSASLSSLSISEAQRLQFDMYPNPATDAVTLQLATGSDKATVQFYDYLGRLALTKTISSSKEKINVHSLSTGIYILKVLSDDKIGTQKLIKK